MSNLTFQVQDPLVILDFQDCNADAEISQPLKLRKSENVICDVLSVLLQNIAGPFIKPCDTNSKAFADNKVIVTQK